MNRLYVSESTPTTTGAKADHRLPVRAVDVKRFFSLLSRGPHPLTEVGSNNVGLSEDQYRFMVAVGKELETHRGGSVIIVGDHQPPILHALAHAINQGAGNVGKTVFYSDPVDANPINQTESIKDLVADMNGCKVDLLIILGGNPAYDAPADLNFRDALKNGKVPQGVAEVEIGGGICTGAADPRKNIITSLL